MAPAVVVIPAAICRLFRKKMSSLFDVTVRDSLSPFCREGEKKKERKDKVVTLVSVLNHWYTVVPLNNT